VNPAPDSIRRVNGLSVSNLDPSVHVVGNEVRQEPANDQVPAAARELEAQGGRATRARLCAEIAEPVRGIVNQHQGRATAPARRQEGRCRANLVGLRAWTIDRDGMNGPRGHLERDGAVDVNHDGPWHDVVFGVRGRIVTQGRREPRSEMVGAERHRGGCWRVAAALRRRRGSGWRVRGWGERSLLRAGGREKRARQQKAERDFLHNCDLRKVVGEP
jgi:hypothetical protein